MVGRICPINQSIIWLPNRSVVRSCWLMLTPLNRLLLSRPSVWLGCWLLSYSVSLSSAYSYSSLKLVLGVSFGISWWRVCKPISPPVELVLFFCSISVIVLCWMIIIIRIFVIKIVHGIANWSIGFLIRYLQPYVSYRVVSWLGDTITNEPLLPWEVRDVSWGFEGGGLWWVLLVSVGVIRGRWRSVIELVSCRSISVYYW